MMSVYVLLSLFQMVFLISVRLLNHLPIKLFPITKWTNYIPPTFDFQIYFHEGPQMDHLPTKKSN